MPSTVDIREVVEEIKTRLENAVFDHNLDLLADVYNTLVQKTNGITITAFRDYFIVEEN